MGRSRLVDQEGANLPGRKARRWRPELAGRSEAALAGRGPKGL